MLAPRGNIARFIPVALAWVQIGTLFTRWLSRGCWGRLRVFVASAPGMRATPGRIELFCLISRSFQNAEENSHLFELIAGSRGHNLGLLLFIP
jgi:hypothetical protein